ncbi:hypothetical protein AX16_010747 [Volvariella volvacea WC 439]|nr:hypothetical protein AX16_010747 [Volvariella volvacea WC 439]
MAEDYKQAKEAFVSGMTGSTITHINKISFTALCSIALYSAVRTRLAPTRSIPFPVSWTILVVPLLLSMTLYANSPGTLALWMLVPTGLVLLLPAQESGSSPLPSSVPPSSPATPRHHQTAQSASLQGPYTSNIPMLPALTTYRAHMMLMTILGILAVDFPVFPRSLAKCETYGVSLMDLGVGSFVFSQGIVSAIPLLKNPAYLTSPLGPKVGYVVRKALPILVLGLVRVVLVKGTEYPEHESEYGTHWNFFITLALVPVLQVLLHPIIQRAPISMIAICIAFAHQLGLSFLGLESYILFEPRKTLISANKEGIVSLPGYLAIHLLGLSTGTLILPPSPSWFRRQQKDLKKQHQQRKRKLSDAPQPSAQGEGKKGFSVHRENDRTATELCSYSIVWWTLLWVTQLVGVGSPAGGGDTNLPYILWISAFNTTFVLCYLLLDLFFFPSPLSKSLYDPTSKLKLKAPPSVLPPFTSPDSVVENTEQLPYAGSAPALLEAINKNSLVLFLVANVATGLINLTIQTMYVADRPAMFILSAYAFGLSFFAWLLRSRRIIQL